MLGDQAFEPRQAGVPEQVRTDFALLEWCQVNAVDPPRQKPRQIGLAHRQRQLAQRRATVPQNRDGQNRLRDLSDGSRGTA